MSGLVIVIFSCTQDMIDPSACNTSEVTYTDDVASIINGSCAVPGCHVGGQSPLLTDFASTAVGATGPEFLPRINHEEGFSAMPPAGMLEQCEIDIITAWIAAGTPE